MDLSRARNSALRRSFAGLSGIASVALASVLSQRIVSARTLMDS
jgi:hypothetical protein